MNGPVEILALNVIVGHRRDLFEVVVPEPAGSEGSFWMGGDGRTLMVEFELGCRRFGWTCPPEVLAALMYPILLAGPSDRLENRDSHLPVRSLHSRVARRAAPPPPQTPASSTNERDLRSYDCWMLVSKLFQVYHL